VTQVGVSAPCEGAAQTPRSAAGTGLSAPQWLRTAYLVWLTPIAVFVGAVLRVRNWLHDRSLWLDEILVARSISTRGLGSLVHPLPSAQAAPIGWLWAERLSVDAFRVNEYALRLVPLLSALVALAIFPITARLLLGRTAAPVATVLFATSPALIYFASETKQYSSDVTCVLLALLVTVPLTRRSPTLWTALLWGLACSLLAWCSFPAMFVAAACGLALAARWARQPRALLALAAGGALLAANVCAEYLVLLSRLSQNRVLDGYWEAVGGYPPRSGTAVSDVRWLYKASLGVLHDPAQLALPGLVVVIAVWGVVSTARRNRVSAALLSLPVAVAIALAVTSHYPMSRRLALYLLPSILLLLTAGAVDVVAVVAEKLPRVRGAAWAACAVAAALLVATAGGTTVAGLRKLVHPDEVTAGREATAFIATHQRHGDLVLIESPWGLANLNWYGPRLGVRKNGGFTMTSTGCRQDPLKQLEGSGRVWILLAHRNSAEPTNRSRIYLSHFETKSSLIQSYRGAGDAGAYLLDFSKPPLDPPVSLNSWVPNGCVSASVNTRPTARK
jgi:hypothetical protein